MEYPLRCASAMMKKMNERALETPFLIRYGELTNDEYFITEKAAKEGVVITNLSSTEPIVMLKHFAENPQLEGFFE